MAFNLPREPSTQESLQCLASAGLQEIGGSFADEDLIKLMKGVHDKQSQVESKCGIDWGVMRDRFKQWSSDPSDPKLLGAWIFSSISVAKSLQSSSYLQGDYVFYRQDRFPTNGTYGSFKDMFDVLKNRIRATVKKDPNFAKGVAGKVLSRLSLNSDKWNPADIVAVKSGKETEWNKKINGFLSRTNAGAQLKNDLTSYIRRIQKKGTGQKKLDIIPAMDDLYEYNKMIFEGIDKKEFVPISLKKSEIDSPKTKLTKIAEPSDLEKYFSMKVKVDKIQMKGDDQKAIIFFKVDGLPGKEGSYSFDIRGFESTSVITDIQLGLLKKGGSTYQGKITLPITTMITKLTGGRAALSRMNAEKRKRFKNLDSKVKNKLKSGIHGFIDYRIFSDYYAKNAANLMTDADAWGEYVQFLSKGKTQKMSFVEQIVGDKTRSKKADQYKLAKSFTRAKYMKNKLQSYEVAYIMDSSPLSKQVKDDILKSMWMYAASEGFTIFNKNSNVTFLLASSYIKCSA